MKNLLYQTSVSSDLMEITVHIKPVLQAADKINHLKALDKPQLSRPADKLVL